MLVDDLWNVTWFDCGNGDDNRPSNYETFDVLFSSSSLICLAFVLRAILNSISESTEQKIRMEINHLAVKLIHCANKDS